MATKLSIKEQFLKKISAVIIFHSQRVVVVSVLLAILCGVYAVFSLKFDTDQDNLISNKQPYHQRYKKYLSAFGDLEYIYVVYEVPDGGHHTAKEALDKTVEKLKLHPNLFKEISYKENFNKIKNSFLLIISSKQFNEVKLQLENHSDTLKKYLHISKISQIFTLTSHIIEKNQSELQAFESQLTSLMTLLREFLQVLRGNKLTLTNHDVINSLLGSDNYVDDGYFFSPNGKLLFLKIMPVKDYATTEVVEKPLIQLRSIVNAIKQDYPTLSIGITGRPVLQADEMASTGVDSLFAGIAALIGVGLLFMLFLRQVKAPLLSLLALVMSLLWTLGFVTLTLGHLNLLTIIFTIILVGLGIDYGIHFLYRYQKFCIHHTNRDALEMTLMGSGQAIITAAISSAIAFFSALFTNFLGLQELGFVAGSGVMFCLLSQIITFPALVLLTENKHTSSAQKPLLFSPESLVTNNKRLILIGLSIITLIGIPFVAHVKFENNLLELQDPTLESVIFERKITDSTDISTWVAAFLTRDALELPEIEAKLSQMESVGHIESLSFLLPSIQNTRLDTLKKISQKLKAHSLPSLQNDTQETLLAALIQFDSLMNKLQLSAFKSGKPEAVEEIESIMSEIQGTRTYIEKADPATLKKIQDPLLKWMNHLRVNITSNLNPSTVNASQLPESFLRRYLSKSGLYVTYAYPMEDIWKPHVMDKFIKDMKSIDPKVTGSPIQVYESAKLMHNGFYVVALLTLCAVFLILRIDYGNFFLAFFASLPLIVGIFWLVMLMGMMKLDFNLGNFFAVPILIGVGIDNGVHLIHAYLSSGNLKDSLKDVSPPIILSSLTTIIGFGALSFVSHQGLSSFGKIMTLGSLTCLISTLLLVPIILQTRKFLVKEEKSR